MKCYLRRWEGSGLCSRNDISLHPDCFLQQPLYLSTKRDSVKYVSLPMPEDVTVIGPAAFNFYASIDTDDTNWIVKLSDVAPGGTETPLAKGYSEGFPSRFGSREIEALCALSQAYPNLIRSSRVRSMNTTSPGQIDECIQGGPPH